MTPEVLSHYRIVRKLGEGGMGEVYLARDQVLGREVALKLLPSSRRFDETVIRRFRLEARAVSALNHPNIVIIHEIGEDEGYLFLVTELIRGKSLRRIIGQEIGLDRLLELATGIAAALQAAHEAGVVHRDVKPDNVMVNEHDVVKLLDFGLAQLAADDAPQIGESGLIGTVPYMSPEQIRGEVVDGRSDVFSLGILLYEMLCLRRPFDDASTDATLSAILEREPAERDLMRYSSALRRLVMRMLAKSRSERPTSDEVTHQLRAIRRSLDSPSRELDETTVERPRTETQRRADTPHNLPPLERPLFGRGDERRAVIELFEQSDVRMITITGSGGCGKTHLALEVGKRLLGRFPDGVFFVSLAQVEEPDLVPAAIAHELGVRETEAYGAEDRILSILREKQLLLILDNFEHLLEAAGFLSTLLTAAERISLLVTSREPVRTRWEQEYPLEPLPLPASRSGLGDMRESPAVELFVQEAQRTSPGFILNEENAEAVAEICRELDGLPLAIGLAAARVKLLTPAAIATRLRESLALLKGGSRDLPQRQRTMQDAIDWSVRLLSDEERHFLAQLSVFSGGCDIEAAAAVQEMSDDETIEMLGALIDKSLLRRDVSTGGAVRFTMFETIRQYARKMLDEHQETAVRDRHASHFAQVAEAWDRQLIGETQPFAMSRLAAEHANFRLALDWALRRSDSKTALKLAGSLWRFWNLAGRFREGRRLLDEVLDATKGERAARIRPVYGAGILADAQGDFGAAERHFSEMLDIARELNDSWGVANALNNLGIAALRRGELDSARTLQEKSLEVWKAEDNRPAAALSLQNLGNVARVAGDLESARRLYDQAREIFLEIEDGRGAAWSLNLLADIERRRGGTENARALLEESLESFMEIRDHWGVAASMSDLGDVMIDLGDLDEADSLLEESLLIYREIGDLKSCATVLEKSAIVSMHRQQPERTLRLAAAAVAIRRSIGAAPPAERIELGEHLTQARESLDEETARSVWKEGEGFTIDRAIEYAESG